MTNEEKAREVAKNNECYYTEPHYEFGELQDFEIDSYNECEKSALEMAEWKDQQFKEYLEKKRAKAADAYSENTSDFKAGELHMVFEIINELFPESGQDNTDREE